mmetsp:Transcript_8879/g.20931  ORF Transcript_8879/g.20931 Transcript_8879/m.20931 type:complete len:222 (+) Transcript_8879:32-697(+)
MLLARDPANRCDSEPGGGGGPLAPALHRARSTAACSSASSCSPRSSESERAAIACACRPQRPDGGALHAGRSVSSGAGICRMSDDGRWRRGLGRAALGSRGCCGGFSLLLRLESGDASSSSESIASADAGGGGAPGLVCFSSLKATFFFCRLLTARHRLCSTTAKMEASSRKTSMPSGPSSAPKAEVIASSPPRTTSAHAMSCVADIGGSPASAAPTCTAR